jgi:hypothetical protein
VAGAMAGVAAAVDWERGGLRGTAHEEAVGSRLYRQGGEDAGAVPHSRRARRSGQLETNTGVSLACAPNNGARLTGWGPPRRGRVRGMLAVYGQQRQQRREGRQQLHGRCVRGAWQPRRTSTSRRIRRYQLHIIQKLMLLPRPSCSNNGVPPSAIQRRQVSGRETSELPIKTLVLLEV